ncbi:hypothetical protein GRX03_15280 [Halovenus sp. WSH3]|uniref:Uncharacterized protein n=1 Tax=Halovenus carboxidivorans TaxID=2692199 RepID=A0A6B0TCJ9_9EURY|nr:HTH domain-containing protein [Halovenus carboxidivorans]MXR52961.1 hypothetical protein [Halovenus carboxidivorans]
MGASLIDSYEISMLGERLCYCCQCRESSGADRLRETVDQLRGWEDGGLAASGFEERDIDSAITDEQYRVIVPPELTLGVYFDDTLAGVFPCEGEVHVYQPDTYLTMGLDQYAEASQDSGKGVTF